MQLETVKGFRVILRQLEREIEHQLKCETDCCGVTLSQCHIILEVGAREAASVVDLAEALGVDTSTLSRNINGMVNIGLVNRVLNPKDRRYVSITLTEQGEAVYRSIEDMCNEHYIRVFRHIPEEKHDMVVEGLGLLVEALLKEKQQGKSCCL